MTKAPSPPNPILLLAEQLRELSVPELVVRYEREWGRPPRVHHACWLRKQIARRASGNTSKPASWEWVKTGQSRVRGRCLCSESLIRRKS